MNIESLELALRILATYGQVLVSLVFLLAAGILLARTKSVPTVCFLAACCSQHWFLSESE
ncbi:MAG: hypothetical protein WBC07_03900 [Methylotenera sp.]